MSKITHERRVRRTVGSMRWAAWADALGFISELTSDAGLRRRLRGRPLTDPVEWTRRVGGKFGPDVKLPAGCYSDDTQLRLATARAVNSRGFDVEAFARIELALWPAYALGGGHASKAAAANMTKPSTPWFGNFYDGWLKSGGNGVAMRIQPHVWAAPQPATTGRHVLDVIVNGTTSHGHPRALVGAVLHALALGATLHDGRVPSVNRWPELLDSTENAVKLIDEHPQLASFWRPAWESHAKTSLAVAWQIAVHECRDMLPIAARAATFLSKAGSFEAATALAAYDELVTVLDLRDPAKRGQATSTVIAAMTLAAAAPTDPAGAARLAANMVGTDTDTIATMAAALIGASDATPDPEPVLDAEYLTAEATRLAEIASGYPTASFSYPDLLHWTPPRTQVDAVGLARRRPALAGLAWLEKMEGTETVEAQGAEWLWTTSDFGESFLVKRRATLRELPEGNWPTRREQLVNPRAQATEARLFDHLPFDPTTVATGPTTAPPARTSTTVGLPRSSPPRASSKQPDHDRVDVDQMLEWVSRHGYADGALGYATRRIAQLGTAEQLIAFTTGIRDAIRHAPR